MSFRTESDFFERPSLLVGVLLAIAGAFLLFAPGIAAAIPGHQFIVIGIGAIALVVGVNLGLRRRRIKREVAETGEPELPMSMAAPGDELEQQLATVEQFGRSPVRVRKRIVQRLRKAAIAVVRRHERCSTEQALQLVLAGEWTDDYQAAVFIGNPSLPPPTLRDNIRATFSLKSRFGYRARRTIAAILELAEDIDIEAAPSVDAPDNPLGPGPAVEHTNRFEIRETGRWAGVGALALIAGAVGMVFTQPAVLLLSIVGVTYSAFARNARPPQPSLSVERELSTTSANPTEPVDVTVRVENTGASLLSDIRLVDGVPAGLPVIEGSPRLGTSLRPGATARFSYTVKARRGRHEFGPMQIITRDPSGAQEREDAIGTDGVLECIPQLTAAGEMPLYGAATRYTGQVKTRSGGEGLEFYATREYRPGDPPSRIDWNRHARSRELATLLFREERAATVILLIDARRQAFRSPGPEADHAVSRSVTAAGQLFDTLLEGGDRVGIASFGPRAAWLAPGAGTDHRERARRLLALDDAFAYAPPSEEFLPSAHLMHVRKRAPVDAQFVLLTPLTDDYIGTVARRLQAHGHPVTVVSPDVTTGGNVSRRLVRVERETRLNALREADIRVIDWDADELLAVAMSRASVGWSR